MGHVMRAYLARTETFVYNQMAALRRYRPVVAAHHRREATDYPLEEGLIAEDALPSGLALLERAAYRLRVALPPAHRVLAGYLRHQDARLLHFHYLTDARFLLGVHRRAELPSLVSGYGYDVSSFPAKWRGMGRRYLHPIFDRMDLFLAMSEDMASDLEAIGCPEDKIEIHYYGSEVGRFRHPERRYGNDGPPVVLCCARLHPAKGVQLVLEALRRLAGESGRDFRVVIVGDGPMRPELESLVSSYGWDERVTFTGHVAHTSSELVRHFRRADIFAHPSITLNGLKEGIPGTIVEAMAAGLPVVATRHAGIPAVIGDGEHGLLVGERDLKALADALEALLADTALRERLGRAAARRATKELDVSACAVELERIYERFT